MPRLFQDRRDAGRQLAAKLMKYAGRPGVLVLGLPRGGIPVAYEVAHALGAPLDVCTARKLGMPGHEEFAIGAIASGGVCVLHHDTIRAFGVPESAIAMVRAKETMELGRRDRLYRGNRPPLDVHGSIVILVDDGLATGATMQAAVTAIRADAPARIVVAAPVASTEAHAALSKLADECVCIFVPSEFVAVGAWYEHFAQTEDAEVHALLDLALDHLPEDARESTLHARAERQAVHAEHR